MGEKKISDNGVVLSENEGEFSSDENKERGNWSGRMDFLLSCIGFAVGLGNVWRFPYICYVNGGGAFLIPYVIMLAVAGLPLFFFELVLGQFTSLGSIGVWNICPPFRGLGWAEAVLNTIVCIYYNVIIAWAIFFLFSSFRAQVPWADCSNPWNTPACVELSGNATQNVRNVTDLKPTTPAEEYWVRHVLQMTDGIEDTGDFRWQLALCLLAAYVIVFLCLIKGIKSSGKVVYFTALFPYVVLFILLVRGATLPGAIDGIKFYIIPRWEKLTEAGVWVSAASQIFYSLGPCWGGLITFASYNRFHNNCLRDAVIVSVVNCGTSVFAGFVIFSMIGHMAHELNVDVANVTDSGPGLAFVAYPTGIALMPVSPLWAILFFLMLILLGLDSMFTMMETVITAFSDRYPRYLRRQKLWFTLATCVVFFLLGLPMVTQSGIYWLTLANDMCATYPLLIIGVLEIIAIIYIYGIKRFQLDIRTMLGFQANYYWLVCWCVLTPASLLFIIVFFGMSYGRQMLGSYVYPMWAETLGWLMAASSLIWIPVMAVISYIQFRRGGGRSFRAWFHVTPEFGPALAAHQEERQAVKENFGSSKLRSTSSDNKDASWGVPGHFNPAFTPDTARNDHI